MKTENLLNEFIIHDILPYCVVPGMQSLSLASRSLRNMTLNAALAHFSTGFKVPLGDINRAYPESDLTLFSMVNCCLRGQDDTESAITAFNYSCSM